jgi:transcriptional regulator with XRE-family HTH domain
MNIHKYKERILTQNPDLKDRLSKDMSFQIGKMLLRARLSKGFSQDELARLANTKQPSIARIESGSQLPSISFLQRVVNAMGYTLESPKITELECLEANQISRGRGVYHYSVSGMHFQEFSTKNSLEETKNFQLTY